LRGDADSGTPVSIPARLSCSATYALEGTAMLDSSSYNPRFRVLTPMMLLHLPDSQLLDAIYDHAVLTMEEDTYLDPELVASLPEGVRAVWAVILFEVLMGCGGLNLLFWTEGEPGAETILAGLRYLGAKEHAALVCEAVETAVRTQSRMTPYRLEGSQAAYRASLGERLFCSLEARYWGLPDLKRILVQAVRDNPKRFCLP